MNQRNALVAVAVAALLLYFYVSVPGSLFSNSDCVSYSSTASLSSDNRTFTVNINQQRAFNSQWGSGTLSACIRNFGGTPEQQEVVQHQDEFTLTSITGSVDSGCGDIVPFTSMDLQGRITLERGFSEANLPSCYSTYRRSGWADGLNVQATGKAVFQRSGGEQQCPTFAPVACPVGQHAELQQQGLCSVEVCVPDSQCLLPEGCGPVLPPIEPPGEPNILVRIGMGILAAFQGIFAAIMGVFA